MPHVTNLERNIGNLQYNQMTDLLSLRSSLSHEIYELKVQMERIEQNSKPIFNESVVIQRYNKPAETAEVEISFNFKEYQSGDIVNITAEDHNGQIYKAMAILSEAGKYSATLELPLKDNYTLNYTVAGLSIKSGELAKLALANELCERFAYNYGISRQHGTKAKDPVFIGLQPYITNDTQGHETLAIKEISMIIESDGTVIGTVDLLPYLRSDGNLQIIGYEELWGQIIIPIDNTGDINEWRDYVELYFSREYTPKYFMEPITPDKSIVARLVIYDHLGIRYEQADEIFDHIVFGGIAGEKMLGGSSMYRGGVTDSMSVTVSGGGGSGGGSAYNPYSTDQLMPARLIDEGEYAWGSIHIVR